MSTAFLFTYATYIRHLRTPTYYIASITDEERRYFAYHIRHALYYIIGIATYATAIFVRLASALFRRVVSRHVSTAAFFRRRHVTGFFPSLSGACHR